MANVTPIPTEGVTAPPTYSPERDRLELWHLESFLMVNGTTEAQRERRLRLYRYLCATCQHEWSDVSGWGGCPKGTHQCSWCNEVLTPEEWSAHIWPYSKGGQDTPDNLRVLCRPCNSRKGARV